MLLMILEQEELEDKIVLLVWVIQLAIKEQKKKQKKKMMKALFKGKYVCPKLRFEPFPSSSTNGGGMLRSLPQKATILSL